MIRKIYDKVYGALRDEPDLRDNDRKLLLHIWESEGLYLNQMQKARFMGVSSPETIRRARQKIQADGYFPSSKAVKKKRKELEQEVKHEAVADKVEARTISWLKD